MSIIGVSNVCVGNCFSLQTNTSLCTEFSWLEHVRCDESYLVKVCRRNMPRLWNFSVTPASHQGEATVFGGGCRTTHPTPEPEPRCCPLASHTVSRDRMWTAANSNHGNSRLPEFRPHPGHWSQAGRHVITQISRHPLVQSRGLVGRCSGATTPGGGEGVHA